VHVVRQARGVEERVGAGRAEGEEVHLDTGARYSGDATGEEKGQGLRCVTALEIHSVISSKELALVVRELPLL